MWLMYEHLPYPIRTWQLNRESPIFQVDFYLAKFSCNQRIFVAGFETSWIELKMLEFRIVAEQNCVDDLICLPMLDVLLRLVGFSVCSMHLNAVFRTKVINYSKQNPLNALDLDG